MNKLFRALAVFPLCAVALMAQGNLPTALGTPNNTYSFYSKIVRPNSSGSFSSCYWFNFGSRANTVTYPVIGMPVIVTSYTTCGSGWHAHDASCNDGRPQMDLSISGTVMGSVAGWTDATGCLDFAGLMPSYAGYATVKATNADFLATIVTPAGAIVATYPAGDQGSNFTLQDYGPPGTLYPSTDPTNPQPYPAYPYDSTINNLNYEPLDFAHGSAINNALPKTITQTQMASLEYFQGSEEFVGYDDWIIIWRMSLPWGGIADNGVAQTITSFVPGDWDATTPYNAANVYGTSVEFTNPSLSPFMPITNLVQTNDAANYALWVFDQNGCRMGTLQPTFDPTIADTPMLPGAIEAFWEQQQHIHMECGYSLRKAGGR